MKKLWSKYELLVQKQKHDIISICISVLKWCTRAVFSKYYETSIMIGYILLLYQVLKYFLTEIKYRKIGERKEFTWFGKNKVSPLLSPSLSLSLSLSLYWTLSLSLFLSFSHKNFQHKLWNTSLESVWLVWLMWWVTQTLMACGDSSSCDPHVSFMLAWHVFLKFNMCLVFYFDLSENLFRWKFCYHKNYKKLQKCYQYKNIANLIIIRYIIIH